MANRSTPSTVNHQQSASTVDSRQSTSTSTSTSTLASAPLRVRYATVHGHGAHRCSTLLRAACWRWPLNARTLTPHHSPRRVTRRQQSDAISPSAIHHPPSTIRLHHYPIAVDPTPHSIRQCPISPSCRPPLPSLESCSRDLPGCRSSTTPTCSTVNALKSIAVIIRRSTRSTSSTPSAFPRRVGSSRRFHFRSFGTPCMSSSPFCATTSPPVCDILTCLASALS